jgi:putative transposase
MPRTARVVVPGMPHHLILRGNNRRRLFSYSSDYERFLSYLRRALAKSGVRLHGLSLMPNHIHLIVRPADAAALSLFVKLIAQRYAQTRNFRRDGSGKLFEQRYYCVPIVSDEQLAMVTAYVDLNAFRAHTVEDPAQHRWCTYRLHAGLPNSDIPADLWTPSDWYLSLGATPEARAQRYRQFAAEYGARHRAGEAAEAAAAAAEPPLMYTRRLERPDGSRAAESGPVTYPETRRSTPAKRKMRTCEKYPRSRAGLRGRRVSPSS